jgi:putative MATE family efflux protein
MGNSKVSMLVSGMMNIINVLVNVLLLFGLGMGVAGAGIATLIARITAALTMLLLLTNKKHPIHIEKLGGFRPDLIMIRRILQIGVPNGLENSVFQIGKILVQGMIAGLGTSAITANAVANTIGGFGVLPGSAIGLALITVVGRCVGAGDYDGVKKYTIKLMKFAYVFMAVINILILCLLPIILWLYKLSDETAAITRSLMIYHCILATLIWPVSFALPNALRAANDVKFTMWVSMISMWLWRIGFSYILAILLHVGVLGIWIAMTATYSEIISRTAGTSAVDAELYITSFGSLLIRPEADNPPYR